MLEEPFVCVTLTEEVASFAMLLIFREGAHVLVTILVDEGAFYLLIAVESPLKRLAVTVDYLPLPMEVSILEHPFIYQLRSLELGLAIEQVVPELSFTDYPTR